MPLCKYSTDHSFIFEQDPATPAINYTIPVGAPLKRLRGLDLGDENIEGDIFLALFILAFALSRCDHPMKPIHPHLRIRHTQINNASNFAIYVRYMMQ